MFNPMYYPTVGHYRDVRFNIVLLVLYQSNHVLLLHGHRRQDSQDLRNQYPRKLRQQDKSVLLLCMSMDLSMPRYHIKEELFLKTLLFFEYKYPCNLNTLL